MALQIEELAKQVLAETRVVTNGPVLKPDEPLRVEVIPGGAGGAQILDDTVSFVLNTSYQAAPIRLTVAYKVYGRTSGGAWEELTSGYRIVPTAGPATKREDEGGTVKTTPLGDVPNTLLSIALLMAPKLRFGGKKSDVPIPAVALPDLDRKLVVTLTVSSPAWKNATVSRDIEIPFAVPTVDVPLPAPAVCVCTNGKIDATGVHGSDKVLVLAAPGSPESVAELVATYNSVIEIVEAVKSVVPLMSFVLPPLKKIIDLLDDVPLTEVCTDAEVPDWDDYNDFDDEMRSFVLVAPTGYGIRFCDTANPGAWDDTGDKSYKTYMAIDLLKLPTHTPVELRNHIAALVGLDLAKLTELRNTLAGLTGVAADKLELGLGLIGVGDLGETSLTAAVINYDKSDSSDDDERLWEPTTIGPDGDVESSKWILP